MAIPWSCIFMVVLPNVGGWIGWIALFRNSEWYHKDHKLSPYAPPDWSIPLIWTVLYCSMGFASYIVWNKGKLRSWMPLMIYFFQLILNWLWFWMFYHFHLVILSLLLLIALDFALLACIITFGLEQFCAGLILVPYFVWQCFATHLNLYFYMDNHLFKKK